MPSFTRKSYLRLFKLTGVFIFLLLFSQLCFAKTAGLKFNIKLDKTEYKEQEPVNATFELENKGQQSVLVNKRFNLNSAGGAKQYQGEVTLILTLPSGKEVPCKFSYEAGLPKTDYFELLQPGKKAASEYPRNLRGYFSFEEPGVYKIEAVYQNIFGKEIGLDVFIDKLSSEPVSFKITK